MRQRAKRGQKAIDERIERLYYARCFGVQVSVLDIGKVFAAGRKAVEENTAISDEALGDAIVAFVNTIRKN